MGQNYIYKLFISCLMSGCYLFFKTVIILSTGCSLVNNISILKTSVLWQKFENVYSSETTQERLVKFSPYM